MCLHLHPIPIAWGPFHGPPHPSPQWGRIRVMSERTIASAESARVRFGSLADAKAGIRDVRFTPKGGHAQFWKLSGTPFCA